ncbi:aflatoxin B1 aldehyde reductase member 3 [Hyaloscypha finlandica]|nr:aflatoxin B1 aldehyde reductase member 3 [Hyaloscypha finlandica]
MPLIANRPKPRVILGLMTFGPDKDAGARITSLPEYNTFLDHLQAAGYNEVDTARTYVAGKQEAFTREARWKDRGLTIATKVYPNEPGKHKPEVLTEAFNTSLKELGTDCVDIFYLHAADRSVPFQETLAAVDKLHKQGKFVQLGLSNFTAFEVAEVVMHCKYNNWLIPACKRYGLDVVVYNPIAGGLFSGKYKAKDIPTDGRFSDAVGKMGEMYRKRYFKDSTFEALAIIEPIVEKHGLTMVETALRWVVNHSALNIKDGNDGVIIGVSNLEQLDENLKDCEKGPLPEEVLQALDKAWKVSQPDTPNYWHLDLKYTYDTRKALFGV